MKCYFKSFYALLFTSLLLLGSCQEDNLYDENSSSEEGANIEISVKDGRLYFPSIESFQEKYEIVKEEEDKEIYNEMSKYYTDDFINLRPIITKDNEDKMYEQLQVRESKLREDFKEEFANGSVRSGEDILDRIDDLEDIVGDEAFASFLNGEAEIQIGNDIYKYTDAGLFIGNDYSKMTEFLDNE